MKRVYILLLILCTLNIADYLTTMLSVGSGAGELNLIANYFINHNALHWFKLVGVGFICIYTIYMAKRDLKSQRRVIKILSWADFAYCLIIISNVAVFFIQKRGIIF